MNVSMNVQFSGLSPIVPVGSMADPSSHNVHCCALVTAIVAAQLKSSAEKGRRWRRGIVKSSQTFFEK
jgi:hypothetical protein